MITLRMNKKSGDAKAVLIWRTVAPYQVTSLKYRTSSAKLSQG